MVEKILSIVELLRDFNIYSVIVRLLLATLLSGIVGIEREKVGRAAGLRTHILVCLGATIVSMTGIYIFSSYGAGGDITRIAAQVVSGIGFLGAGTILVKNKSVVTGLTTAASVWATGAIGIAIGYGFYEASIIGSLLILLVNGKLGRMDKKISQGSHEIHIYIEFENAKFLNDTLKEIKEIVNKIDNIVICTPKTNVNYGIALELIIDVKEREEIEEKIEKINKLKNVNFAILLK